MISLSKYFLLRDTYEERSKLLEKTIQEESRFLQLNESLKNDLLKEQSERNNLEREKQRLEFFSTPKFLNGEWIYSISDALTNESKTILINDGFVAEIWNKIRDKKVIGRIQNFHFNPLNKEIIFYLSSADIKNSNQESHFYILTFSGDIDNLSLLNGYIDNRKRIQLRKVD